MPLPWYKQMVIQAQVFRGSYIQKVSALQIFMSQWTTVMVSDTVASDISIFPCKGKYNKNYLFFHARNDDFAVVPFTEQQIKKRMNKSCKPLHRFQEHQIIKLFWISISITNNNNYLHKGNYVGTGYSLSQRSTYIM